MARLPSGSPPARPTTATCSRLASAHYVGVGDLRSTRVPRPTWSPPLAQLPRWSSAGERSTTREAPASGRRRREDVLAEAPTRIGVTDDDLRTTLVVSFPIDEGSAKVRSGLPSAGTTGEGFVGVIPIRHGGRPAVRPRAASVMFPPPDMERASARPPRRNRGARRSPSAGTPRPPLGRRPLTRVQPDGWLAAYAQRTPRRRPHSSGWAARAGIRRDGLSGSSA